MRSLLRLFERRPAPAPDPAPAVTLAVTAVAQHTPTAGLVVIDVQAGADEPIAATLRVFGPGGAQPALEKSLTLDAERRVSWIAIHGHLLPNGPAELRFDLVDADGRRLAETPITVQISNEGALAEATRASLQRHGVPLAVDCCDSSRYDYADETLAAWFDRSAQAVEDHLAGLAASGAATADEIAALRHFAEEGYLILPGAVGAEHLGRLNAALDDAVERKLEGYEWGASQRLHGLHQHYPAIHELWTHPTILRMLRLIFGADARPYQTLTYIFGSEQQYHQDTVVLTPFPAGRMCGVWTALEDIGTDCGELMIYPKSHRFPRVYMRNAGIAKITDDYTEFGEVVAPMYAKLLGETLHKPMLYRPAAGTVLIWHENLMHGGRVRADKSKSRRSIVGHYFADGCVAYHDANGMPGALSAP